MRRTQLLAFRRGQYTMTHGPIRPPEDDTIRVPVIDPDGSDEGGRGGAPLFAGLPPRDRING